MAESVPSGAQSKFPSCTALVKEEPAINTAAELSDSGEGDVNILYERVPCAGSAGGLNANGKRTKQLCDKSGRKKHSSAKDSHEYALGSKSECDTGSVTEDAIYRFIEKKVAAIQRDTKCERARNIQKAVAESLQYLLKEVEKLEPVFGVSELIQVGSHAEGTKINEPDEFDFLAVVYLLSKEGTVIIDHKEDSWRTGSVSLVLGDISVNNELSKFCEKGEMQCFQGKSLSESFFGATKFGTTFIKGVMNTFRKKLLKIGSSRGMIMCTPVDINFAGGGLIFPPVNGITLLLKDVQFKTPNILLEYELEGLEIGVDLSPAIRYHRIEDCINPAKCASPELLEAIRQHGSVLLVGDKLGGFRITVTECEVKYMQEIMRKRHKLLYIFFKHICHLFRKLYPFTSYMLKQICIHHDAKCESDSEALASCLGKIIQNITMYCSEEELPTVLNKDVDLFRGILHGHSIDWHVRLHFLIALRELHQYSLDTRNRKRCEAVLYDAINTLDDKFSSYLDKHRGIESVSFDVVSSSFTAQEDRLHCPLCDDEQTVNTVSFQSLGADTRYQTV